jgi:predicted nucleic acid-binding protein
VFDCNVFFQALIGEHGPAAACLNRAGQGRIDLICSEYIVEEVRDLCSRPSIRARFRITDVGLHSLLRLIRDVALFYNTPIRTTRTTST